MKMRDVVVEKQVQQVLSYVQRELADIQKENIIEDLENESLAHATVEEFLTNLKQELGRGDNEMLKVAEMRKVEQKSKTIEKFVQKFRRTVRGSRYERKLLMEDFKQGIKYSNIEKVDRSEISSWKY